MTKEKNIKKQILLYSIYLIIILGLTALAIYFTLGKNYQNVLSVLGGANWVYIMVVFFIVIACILTRSLVLYLLATIKLRKYSFHRAIALDQVGVFYRTTTPAGLGGNVMQTATFKRQGISISTGASIVAMYFIVYQFALIIYNIITLIIKGSLINDIGFIAISFTSTSHVNIPLWLLISIGFLFNLGSIGLIFLLSFWKGFYKFVDGPILKLLVKMKILKDIDYQHDKLNNAAINFRNNLKNLFSHWKIMLSAFLLCCLYITISYSVPYFVGLSLGNTSTSANFFDSVFLSNLHQMVTTVLPLPGGTMVSELFFLKLFYPVNGAKFYSSEEIARASLLLWRSLMFIIPLFISLIYTICYFPRKRNYDNIENQEI